MGNKYSYPTFTIEEVQQHNHINDCYIIINKKVYDVTNYIYQHPGSTTAILNKAGTDCSYDMNFHSLYAIRLLKKYFIGYLK